MNSHEKAFDVQEYRVKKKKKKKPNMNSLVQIVVGNIETNIFKCLSIVSDIVEIPCETLKDTCEITRENIREAQNLI